MARSPPGRKTLKGQCSETGSDLAFVVGADDGNRTRTVSLGICTVWAYVSADLRRDQSASDQRQGTSGGFSLLLITAWISAPIGKSWGRGLPLSGPAMSW